MFLSSVFKEKNKPANINHEDIGHVLKLLDTLEMSAMVSSVSLKKHVFLFPMAIPNSMQQ